MSDKHDEGAQPVQETVTPYDIQIKLEQIAAKAQSTASGAVSGITNPDMLRNIAIGAAAFVILVYAAGKSRGAATARKKAAKELMAESKKRR